MANLQNAKDIKQGIVTEAEIQTRVETYSPPTDLTPYSTTTQMNAAIAAAKQITKSATAPASPTSGDFWFDTDDYQFKFYDGSDWQMIKSAFSATGGSSTDAVGFRYHVFNTSGTFQITKGSADLEYLIVAGGGGGGYQVGGGGGAGGLLNGSATVGVGTYAVVIGAGGAGSTGTSTHAFNGSNSSVLNLTAIGGGYGGNHNVGYDIPTSGGSGGGGGGNSSSQRIDGASGTTGQGNKGGMGWASSNWSGGGGGGAGGVGATATGNAVGGNGGVGKYITGFDLWGTSNPTQYGIGGASQNGGGWFAGGGGGCTDGLNAASLGGAGGGGRGFGNNGQSYNSTTHGDDGAVNTGGGAGGVRDRYNNSTGYPRSGNGGSGIVIIRYPI